MVEIPTSVTPTYQRVIHADDLTDADRRILDELHAGARTKKAIVDSTGLHRNTVGNRLDVLEAGDVVRCIHDTTALYELVDDPRTDTPEQAADDVDTESESQPDLDVSQLRSSLRAAKSALSGSPPDVDTAMAEVNAALEVLEDG